MPQCRVVTQSLAHIVVSVVILEHESETTHYAELLRSHAVEVIPLAVEQIVALCPNGDNVGYAVACTEVQIVGVVEFEQAEAIV